MRRPTAFLACLLALAGFRVPAGAQEPEAEAPAAEVPEPEPAFPYVPPRLAVTITAGTPGLGDLQSQPATVTRPVLGAGGKIAVETDALTRTVRAEGGYEIGVTGVVSLNATWALRAGVGYGSATLVTAYSGPEADDAVAAVDRLADTESGDLQLLAAQAALRYRLPSSRRVRPFVELGAVALRWSGEGGAAAAGVDEGRTTIGATAGVGAVVPIDDRFSGVVLAESRVFRNPVRGAEPGSAGPDDGTLAVTLEAFEGALFGDPEREVISGTRLSVGIRVGLGRVPPEPAASPEAAASTSPPGR